MDALRGIWLTLRSPRLWGLCLVPLLGALFAYLTLGLLGYFLIVPHLDDWIARTGLGGRGWVIGAEVLAALAYLFLFPLFFVAVAGAFAGLVFDALSHAVEVIESGGDPTRVPRPSLTFRQTLTDSVSRLLLNGTLGAIAFLFGFALGPVPGILAAATIGLLDFTSPAYLRRGLTLGPQARRLFRPTDGNTLLFALIAGLLSLVPFLGVLLLPGLVAGATLLVRRRENAFPGTPGASAS